MNNYEQMREALNNIGNAAAWVAENCNDQQTAKYMNDVIEMVQSAISIPRRQCDVGTAEEQDDRFSDFCLKQGMCEKCEIYKRGGGLRLCHLRWAQMPYAQKGDAE